MRALLVVALTVLAALAGCADGGKPLTAKQGAASAGQVASAWAPDAVLYGAFSFELGDQAKEELREELEEDMEGMDEDGLEGGDGMHADDRAMLKAVLEGHDAPGDGIAPFWSYTYRSENRSAWLTVLVDADGVRHTDEDESFRGAFGFGGPIANWTVDSDAMAEAAAAEVEAYATLQGDPQAAAYSILLSVDGKPYWIVGLEDTNGTADVEVAVSASNGTVSSVEELFDFTGSLPLMEWGAISGGLTPVRGQAGESFELGMGHDAMAVAVEVSGPMLSPVEVTVTDPLGQESSFTVPAASSGFSSRATVVLDSVPEGAWMVDLGMSLPLQHSYTVEWCTDGMPATDLGFVEACGEVGQPAAPKDSLGLLGLFRP